MKALMLAKKDLCSSFTSIPQIIIYLFLIYVIISNIKYVKFTSICLDEKHTNDAEAAKIRWDNSHHKRTANKSSWAVSDALKIFLFWKFPEGILKTKNHDLKNLFLKRPLGSIIESIKVKFGNSARQISIWTLNADEVILWVGREFLWDGPESMSFDEQC